MTAILCKTAGRGAIKKVNRRNRALGVVSHRVEGISSNLSAYEMIRRGAFLFKYEFHHTSIKLYYSNA